MIRRFLPLWFPIVLIAAASAINYSFWQVESAGNAMISLPDRTLAGHVIGISRPAATDPASETCAWRVRLDPDALAALGGIELAYAEGDARPMEEAWQQVPTGSTDSYLIVELGPPRQSARIWLRAGSQLGSVSWALTD